MAERRAVVTIFGYAKLPADLLPIGLSGCPA